MRVIDDSDWHEAKAAMVADANPMARQVLDFTVAWAEAAEDLLDKLSDTVHEIEPIDALRRTLGEAQAATNKVNTMVLSWVLVTLTHLWEPIAVDRDGFAATMTPIEAHMYWEMAQLWLAQRQQQAAQYGGQHE